MASVPGHLDRFPPLARKMAQAYQDAEVSELTAVQAASTPGAVPWEPFAAPRLALEWEGGDGQPPVHRLAVSKV